MVICATYVFLVEVAGPIFMANRKPFDIRQFLIAYNAVQVALSTYIFVGVSTGTFFTILVPYYY